MLSWLAGVYRHILQPIPPFDWFGFNINTLDLIGAIRLCIALRQTRELALKNYTKENSRKSIEEQSFMKKSATTLLVVCGGEMMTAPLLGIPPTFMLSGVIPGLFLLVQTIVEHLPAVPMPGPAIDLPLAVIDGMTRADLLCNFIPTTITTKASPMLSSSPWALLVTSLIMANGGFFLTNLFCLLNPTSLSIETPPELKAYGWTTADLWCAPAGTALYALLTHSQPFWADLHSVLSQFLGSSDPVKPLDQEYAKALCASLLATLFVSRTIKKFGLWKKILPTKKELKIKTQ